MRSGSFRFMAMVAVMALASYACAGDDDGDDGGQEAESPATGEGGEQSDLLIQAFEQDPQSLGLDPIDPPAYASDIVNVDTSEYAMEGNPKIAFAIQAPEFSWPATYNDAVTARQQEAYPDIELILSPTGLGEVDTQVAAIEDLLVQQPDALIITPLTDVRGPIEQAAAQGIPVILCTGTAETDAYVTRVDRDNYLNGAIGAEWIVDQIGGEGKIVMLGGPAGVPTAEARFEGSHAIFDQYEGIEILAEENTNWDAADGKQIMQALLTRFDEIDAVWADGAGQAMGAIEAFKEAGREIPPFAAEPLNGFLRLADEEGFPFVAVGYPPSHSAACLDAAMDVLSGETVPSFINVEVPLFDQTGLAEWYRPNCVDDLWLPTPLSDEQLVEQGVCEA
ncbi:MAG: substrate-binding domain-containing protein [Actinomycetota bacterium]